MAKLYEIVVTVAPARGRPDFPVDMLRYDGLVPNREQDSYTIGRAREERVPGEAMQVELRRYAERNWKPTDGRWDSFGWRVVDLNFTGNVR